MGNGVQHANTDEWEKTAVAGAGVYTHQFSLLIWSPKPGVSITVSFILTPFSSMSIQDRPVQYMLAATTVSQASKYNC